MTAPIRATGLVDGEGSSDAYGYATIAVDQIINTVYFDGVVFEDNGLTGGTAHDFIQNGGEKGLAKVKVELTDCSTNVYSTVYTNGSGAFRLPLPASAGVTTGATLCIQETNPTAYISTGGASTSVTGTYDIANDRHSFTLPATGSPFTGITFGDIAPNTFLTDNQGMALPGTVMFYPHKFTASTAGSVAFSSTAVASPNITGWSNVLYHDVNCDQKIDAGDMQITAPIALLAGDEICLLNKQFVPSNIAYDSRNVVTLQADFTYALVAGVPNPNLPLKSYTRTDTTIVGQEGLVLHKAVNLPTAKSGDIITYTITYTNPTQGVLNHLVIYDTTPAYTTYRAAACGALPNALTACTAAGPTVGTMGDITWTMTGSLSPGASGTVTYQVQVD